VSQSFYSVLPTSLQPIVQNGLLARVFEDALHPLFLYDTLAEIKPWAAQQGAQSIMTKAGLMALSTTPITGTDAPQSNYGFEQYSMFMDQWGNSIDTNMVVSAEALASKFVEDNSVLGTNAAQSLNEVAKQALYDAYAGGITWATNAATSTTIQVANGAGFANAATFQANQTGNTEGLNVGQSTLVAPVSGSNPLHITLNGVANTVTGCSFSSGTDGPATLTLGTSATFTAGQALVSLQAPYQVFPNARASGNQIVSGDIATLATFQAAVTRLRHESVPTIGGAYTAHVPAQTVEELFQDPAFQSAYRGLGPSPVYGDMAIGRFLGIDWVPNEATPIVTNIGGVNVYQPIVAGAGCLIKGPFASMGNLVAQANAGATVHIEMLNGVARILRAPLDRLGQVLTSTWSWIGGYSVGTDLLTEGGYPNSSVASALYKRACVVQHA
jgi:hypothetical protein